jgi:hypothetical protein
MTDAAIHTGANAKATRSERRSDLDVMGVLIVIGLVFFHSAQIFYGGDFFVQNEPWSMVALVAVAFASLWGMPLMFLIAGTSIWYSLRARTVGQFLRERAIRLLVPFVTGLLIVVPPLMYYQLKGDPAYAEGYLGFYPRFFRVRPAWSFPLFIEGAPPDKLFTINHLYFLVYLFAFTVILLPLWLYLRKPAGQRLVERLAAFLLCSWAIFILALPISIIEAALGTEYLGAWNRFAYAPFVVYGFLFACDRRFGQALRRQWKRALVLGILGFILYFAGVGLLFFVLGLDPWTDYGPGGILWRTLKGLDSWFWVVAIMGFVGRTGQKRAATKTSPEANPDPHRSGLLKRAVRYAKGAQLPFYVLHQLPIVIVGFYVVQWPINAFFKYVAIVLSALIITVVLYDIGVRRTRLTRFLFGMKE